MINENMTYEEALSRLEQIVKALEAGNSPLDKSLALFEEGSELVKLCTAKIDAAEQKVKAVTSNGGEEDFKA